MTCLPDTVRQNSKLISFFAELSAKKHGIMQTVERMAEPEMREAMQRPDAGTIPKGASKTVKGTVIYHSPVGDIQLDWEDGAVTALRLAPSDACGEAPNALTARVFRQLDEYFSGTRRTFDFPCRLHGTPFQQRVWAALRDIPYGETRSYKQLAEAIGQPNACRAVGMANHANPILIVIPCHRVICADGSPGGYAGGAEMKKALLRLEQAGEA